MMEPFSVTWTILEIDWILSVFIKKCSKILNYDYQLQLIRVNCEIEYSLC